LNAAVDDFAEIAEVFHCRIMIAMPDTFQPEFVVGDELKIEFADVQIRHLKFPFQERPGMLERSLIAFQRPCSKFLPYQSGHLLIVVGEDLHDHPGTLSGGNLPAEYLVLDIFGSDRMAGLNQQKLCFINFSLYRIQVRIQRPDWLTFAGCTVSPGIPTARITGSLKGKLGNHTVDGNTHVNGAVPGCVAPGLFEVKNQTETLHDHTQLL
jgi:hypothetical protein